MNKEKKKIYFLIGNVLLLSIGFFSIFGLVTVLIPNKFFARMTTITYLDYIFLILTSVLLGVYFAFTIYQKKHGKKVCTASAYSGGVFGFLDCRGS